MLPNVVVTSLNRCFGQGWRSREIDSSGQSRYCVFEVETEPARFALKQHPMERHEHVLRQHAFQSMLDSLPECPVPTLHTWPNGTTWLEDSNRGWELSSWIVGAPMPIGDEIQQDAWDQVIDAIAAMHRRAMVWRAPGEPKEHLRNGVPTLPVGLLERRERIAYWQQQGGPAIRERVDLLASQCPELKNELQLVGTRITHWFPRLSESLAPICQRHHPAWWIVRDCWREHWLFEQSRLSGLIDFGAARKDWPGFDLVRCFGTMLKEGDTKWQSGFERYRRAVPEVPFELQDLLTVHRVSVVLSLLQWFDWYHQGVFDIQRWRSNFRWRELMQRIDAMSSVA